MSRPEVWFTARERFDRSCGKAWNKFVKKARLPHLTELLTLDTVLCPSVITQLKDEDWEHNVHQDHRIMYFHDLDYLLDRISEQKTAANVLAVLFEPHPDSMERFRDERFSFQGYDLIDEGSDISALTNCSGFDKAFVSTHISEVGLLAHYDLAKEVQENLRLYYPEEPHADCALWAIWKMTEQARQ